MAQDDGMVTASEIARFAEVGRAAVSNWRRRFDDFPEPAGGTPASPLFSLTDVESWLVRHGKNGELSPAGRIWRRLRTAAGDADLDDRVGLLGAFLVYLERNRDSWTALAEQDDGELAVRLPEAIAAAVAELPGGLPAAVDTEVIRELAEVSAEANAEIFDDLCRRLAETHGRRVQTVPPEVAALMGRLAGAAGGSVLDPMCGLGGLLAAAEDADLLIGQEPRAAAARIAAVRLLLWGRRVHIAVGDSLGVDVFRDVEAGAVVCRPPTGGRGWPYEEMSDESRWVYGLPPRGESELAWLQHCLAHVKPGGRVVMLMPAAAASRRSGRRIRANLLRAGALRAVITVTPGTGVSHRARDLWLMRRPQHGERPPFHVLMADASGDLSIADSGWAAFSEDPDGTPALPDRCRAVRLIDLLDDDVDFTPGSHVGAQTYPAAAYTTLSERLRAAAAEIAGDVPDIVPGDKGQEPPRTSIAELIKGGAVVLLQAPVTPDYGNGDHLMLTVKDLRLGRQPSKRVGFANETILTEPGDVVVPATASSMTVRVLQEGGAVLGPQIYLFRVDPQRIDPYALAGFIRIACSSRLTRASSTSPRIDPRRAHIPLLPLDAQRRYGKLFRKLVALEATLEDIRVAGEQAVQAAFNGIADGSLQPRPPSV